MANAQRFSFRKNERLASRKLLGELFEKGRSFVIAPFRVSYLQADLPSASPVQVAFSVPVKNFRLATDRNRIKRQMREVYRKNKFSVYALLENQKRQFAVMIVFTGKMKPSFEEVERSLKLTIHRLEEELKKNAE